MTIDRTIHINAPLDRTWEVLAHQFHEAGTWASTIDHSAPRDAGPAPGGAPLPTAGRACETSLGPFRETMVHYDEDRHRFGYTAEGDKMPFFVKRMQNNWTVTPNGPSRSTVVMEMEATLLPVFAQLMGPILKRQLGRALDDTTDDLKYYVEHGRPSPRKLKAAEQARATR